jgi:hypothetical protein
LDLAAHLVRVETLPAIVVVAGVAEAPHSAVPPEPGAAPDRRPGPGWTWSLVHRRDDDRPEVAQVVEQVLGLRATMRWVEPADWSSPTGPHRASAQWHERREQQPGHHG